MFYEAGRFIWVLRCDAAARKKRTGLAARAPQSHRPLLFPPKCLPREPEMGEGRRNHAAGHWQAPLMVPARDSPACRRRPRKSTRAGCFFSAGCFIRIKHPVRAFYRVFYRNKAPGCDGGCFIEGARRQPGALIAARWAAMGLAAYRSRPGACDRHRRRLCSIRPRHSRALCARLCQARPCPPLADSPASLARRLSAPVPGVAERAGALFERVFYLSGCFIGVLYARAAVEGVG